MFTLLVVLLGSWTIAGADDDHHAKKKNRDGRTDFALFDGTNPAAEAPPFGGAECKVKSPAVFYVSVTAHSSGADGFVRATFADGDWVQFPIKADGSLSFTQAIGGTTGVDDRIRISNGGDASGPRLVGWVSVLSGSGVSCQSCNFDDGAGGPGCQNSPGP
jgi:hypothetical protein